MYLQPTFASQMSPRHDLLRKSRHTVTSPAIAGDVVSQPGIANLSLNLFPGSGSCLTGRRSLAAMASRIFNAGYTLKQSSTLQELLRGSATRNPPTSWVPPFCKYSLCGIPAATRFPPKSKPSQIPEHFSTVDLRVCQG